MEYFRFRTPKYSSSSITKLSFSFPCETVANAKRLHERAKGKFLTRQTYIYAFRAEKCQNICSSSLEQAFQHSPDSSYIKMRKETTCSIYITKHNLSLMNSGIRLRNKRSSNQY